MLDKTILPAAYSDEQAHEEGRRRQQPLRCYNNKRGEDINPDVNYVNKFKFFLIISLYAR